MPSKRPRLSKLEPPRNRRGKGAEAKKAEAQRAKKARHSRPQSKSAYPRNIGASLSRGGWSTKEGADRLAKDYAKTKILDFMLKKLQK